MMDNGVQSIFRITPVADASAEAKAEERLIAYDDQYVKTIDLAAKKITVDWGLDY